jgi:nicotinic acid mononucleotide adenylyltransferase
MPAMPESSTEIRRRIATGESVDGAIPRAVANYIAEKKCYRGN